MSDQIDRLIQELESSSSYEKRIDALKALGETGDTRVVEPLIKALADKNSDFVSRAAEALEKIGAPAVEPLIKALWNVPHSAIAVLKKIGASAVEPLIKALEDGYEIVRWYAASILGEIGNIRAIEPLIKALGDDDKYLQRNAAEALGEIGDARAVEPLIRVLGDSNKYISVRRNAAWALGKIGDVRAVEPLIRALGDNDPEVRRCAPEALGSIIGDARAVKPLIKALGDSDSLVRNNAAEALGKIGDALAVGPLIKALGDSDELVRRFVASALKNIINSNQPLFALHPHLLCKECFLKSKKESVKIGVFKSHTYIACRNCKSSLNLLSNVKQVIGLIGGDIGNYKQDGDKVYVNLWYESEKKARNADIDVLEIRASQENFDYDWAVNAVWIELINDGSRKANANYVKNIPVVIQENSKLNDHTMNMLKNGFGEIKTV